MNTSNHPAIQAPSREVLRKMYVEEQKSLLALSKHFKVSATPVKRWLSDYGIELRRYEECAKISRNGFKEGAKHHNWIGDKVSYSALHSWVRRHKGTPRKCEHCGSEGRKKYEWANVSKKYLRNLEDWIRLCTSCHRLYDSKKNGSTQCV